MSCITVSKQRAYERYDVVSMSLCDLQRIGRAEKIRVAIFQIGVII